jgi:hypothetical protein
MPFKKAFLFVFPRRTFLASFAGWSDKKFNIKPDTEVSFGCFCLAPSVGLLLRQRADIADIPVTPLAKEILESTGHDDKLNSASAAIAQLADLLLSWKCEAISLARPLCSNLQDACMNQQKVRAQSVLRDLETTAAKLSDTHSGNESLFKLCNSIGDDELTTDNLAHCHRQCQATPARAGTRPGCHPPLPVQRGHPRRLRPGPHRLGKLDQGCFH